MMKTNLRSKIDSLARMLECNPGFCVLTGAGCSTQSGLPAYRDERGLWKHTKPMEHREFISSSQRRKYYWARSMLGWANFESAKPSQTHTQLTQLQQSGYLTQIITQNVDRLHQTSGSQNVIDLHGRLDQVICMDCQNIESRSVFQDQLSALNLNFKAQRLTLKPDGDVDIGQQSLSEFNVPVCGNCAGVMKPNVVFFGDVLNTNTAHQSLSALENSPGLLVVGSSLMVFSGFRLVKRATQLNKPVVIINQGVTRADDLHTLKIEFESGATLTQLEQKLRHVR